MSTDERLTVTIQVDELRLAMNGVSWLLGFYRGAAGSRDLPSGVKRDVDRIAAWAEAGAPIREESAGAADRPSS